MLIASGNRDNERLSMARARLAAKRDVFLASPQSSPFFAQRRDALARRLFLACELEAK